MIDDAETETEIEIDYKFEVSDSKAGDTQVGGGFTTLFNLVADYAVACGASSINELPGCWEREVGMNWRISLNGHNLPMRDTRGNFVGPFECIVERDGSFMGAIRPDPREKNRDRLLEGRVEESVVREFTNLLMAEIFSMDNPSVLFSEYQKQRREEREAEQSGKPCCW